MRPHPARVRSGRRAARRLLLVGFAACAVLSLVPVDWMRERLRVGCALEGRDWLCGPTTDYVGSAIGIVVLAAAAMVWAWLVLRATADAPRLRAGQLAVVGVLAVAPAVLQCAALLLDATLHPSGGEGLEADRIAMWVERGMLPMLVVAGAGALGFVGLRARASGVAPKVAAIQLGGSMGLLLAAAVMSSLGTLPTGVAAAAAIGAGWLVARAQGRDPKIP